MPNYLNPILIAHEYNGRYQTTIQTKILPKIEEQVGHSTYSP